MNSTIRFYLSLLWRRLPLMAVIFAVCASLGFGLAMTLPAKYRASAELLVESPQITEQLVTRTVEGGDAEQLAVIRQRLRTRANLIDLANRFQVFAGEGNLSPDEIVTQMRERTGIRASSGRNSATIMTLSFEAEDPELAANVVNELVTFVLNEDVRFRTGRAEETLEFFEDEVARLSEELASRSAAIVRFKSANKDALPDEQAIRLNRQDQLQDAINLSLRDRAALNEQRNRLVQMFELTGDTGRPDTQKSAAEIQLEQAQSELASALTIYSENNPRVKILRARIDSLTEQVRGQTVELADQTGETEAAPSSILDLQLDEIDSRVQEIDKAIERAEAELDVLRVSIEASPANGIRLDALEREYNNIQRQYDAANSRLATAATGERIEVLSKGARMSVIEAASVPSEPYSPNRQLIAGGGVLAGGGLAVGLFLLLELLNRAIRRPQDLVRSLNIQPLAVIPYIESTGARRRRRAFQAILAAIVLIGVPLGLWAVHEYYLPLDLLMSKVIDRLGL